MVYYSRRTDPRAGPLSAGVPATRRPLEQPGRRAPAWPHHLNGLHPENAMALEGTLEELNIVAVLQMVASGGMTGTLRVWDVSHRASIAFVQGQIIHADSTLQGDRLGEVLVRTRRITPAQLTQATATQAGQAGKRLGQILVELGLISVEDLAMAVEIQIIEVMS